ncbi:MAG: SDR family oxidoreductase, partial [Devosiaceae bacterium]|nr:SDR family oxidoreductase [Devosiaceae bacterium MH13]
RWLVLGGTSGIGRKVVSEAAKRGHAVRAFGRSADQAAFTDGDVEAVRGDALEAEDVRSALEGCRVVVQALGIRERLEMLWEEETLFSSATRLLLPAMEQAGVSRLITVTGYGAGDSANRMSFPAKLFHSAVLGKPYEDKTRQEELIAASDGIDWTIVRPTVLTNGSLSKRYQVLTDPRRYRLGVISRADVAHYIVDAGEKGLNIHQAVVLV